eukprot:scaffold135446_cov12-Tisochrysis_lutea.AAC.1
MCKLHHPELAKPTFSLTSCSLLCTPPAESSSQGEEESSLSGSEGGPSGSEDSEEQDSEQDGLVLHGVKGAGQGSIRAQQQEQELG